MPTPAGLRLAELAALCGATLEGDGDVLIRDVGTLENASAGAIAFLANAKYRAQLATTQASAVIVSPADADASTLPKLIAANPYATYARVATVLAPPPAVTPGVHPSAVVAASATIAPGAGVGPQAVVGERTVVGERAWVGPGSIVGDDVVLGEDVRLVARVTVYDRCRIGARTIVHAGAVIGADGFGMAEDEGRWIKVPQTGRVVVGSDCEIGANTTIDRGAIEDTVIEDDVKIDNQIQIGHNCRIGRHTAIAGCAGISGSTRIGRNCKIGGAVGVGGHLEIVDDVVVGAFTGVMASITEPGYYAGVFPMLPYRDWQRMAVELRHLRELSRRVRALERAARDESSSDTP